jgi:threonylcarbamoyladenosine tRNA methylthiotransferase MtaB
VPNKIKKERFLRLQKITNLMRDNFIKKNIDKRTRILFEGREGGFWFGYTPNYLRIRYKSKENLKNKIVEIKLNRKNFIKDTA